MKGFVLDNSVVMSWCFEDEKSEHSFRLLKRLEVSSAIVTGIWPFELANALLFAEKKGRISPVEILQFIRQLSFLSITIKNTPIEEVFGECHALAKEYGLTVYDAGYLHLSVREGLPLATFDVELIKAAKKVGIEIL